MTTLWICLYVLATIAAVPLIARGMNAAAHDEWFSSPRFCVFYGLAMASFWPLWMTGWLVFRLVRLLTPIIFPSSSEGEGR